MTAHYTYTEELSVNSTYTENPPLKEGFTTYVNGEVDTTVPGDYEITYTFIKLSPFETITEVKRVTVSASGGITLIGEPVISILLANAQTYVDAGATTPNGTVLVTNLDGTSSETFKGLPNRAGSYTIIYYSSGATPAFAVRTIHVLDPNSSGVGAAPTVGPSAVEVYIPIPTTGPTGVHVRDAAPATGPIGLKAFDPYAMPSTGPRVIEVTITVPNTGPEGLGFEVGKPALGYNIDSLDNGQVVKPSAGYNIESLYQEFIDPPLVGPKSVDLTIAVPTSGPKSASMGIIPSTGPKTVGLATYEYVDALPIYCNTTYEPYGHKNPDGSWNQSLINYSNLLGISQTEPSFPDRPVPGTIVELTWTHNPNNNRSPNWNNQNGTSNTYRHLINEVNYDIHFVWWLYSITPTEIIYKPTVFFYDNVTGGPDPSLEAKLVIDPDDPSKNKFISPPRSNVTFNWWTGKETSRMDYAEFSYSFNSFHAPCFADTGETGTKGFFKYLSNYEEGDRIAEPFGIGTGNNQLNLSPSLTYYRSLVVGGVAADGKYSAFVHPKYSRRQHGGVMTTQFGVQKFVDFTVASYDYTCTYPPAKGPKAVSFLNTPSYSAPIIGIETGEAAPDRPGQSYPIVGTETGSAGSDRPGQSFPIVGIESDTYDPRIGLTIPDYSYPIVKTEA